MKNKVLDSETKPVNTMNKVICSNVVRNLRLLNSSLVSRAAILNRPGVWTVKKNSSDTSLSISNYIRMYATTTVEKPDEKNEKKVERLPECDILLISFTVKKNKNMFVFLFT